MELETFLTEESELEDDFTDDFFGFDFDDKLTDVSGIGSFVDWDVKLFDFEDLELAVDLIRVFDLDDFELTADIELDNAGPALIPSETPLPLDELLASEVVELQTKHISLKWQYLNREILTWCLQLY